jgi:hypothetical protein
MKGIRHGDCLIYFEVIYGANVVLKHGVKGITSTAVGSDAQVIPLQNRMYH